MREPGATLRSLWRRIRLWHLDRAIDRESYQVGMCERLAQIKPATKDRSDRVRSLLLESLRRRRALREKLIS